MELEFIEFSNQKNFQEEFAGKLRPNGLLCCLLFNFETMETLPVYISKLFIATALLTLALLYKASDGSRPFIAGIFVWLVLQTFISLSGFYTVVGGLPPRFMLLLAPPLVFIALLFATSNGRSFISGLDLKTLTLLHVVRIPVELTLFWLFLYNVVPKVMTFEGRNFDILCGLTAPAVYYWGYVKNNLSSGVLVAWNVICLLLLLNVVVIAVLSAPFAFQKFGFEQPNVALFYFPFVLLPGFVVPAVLLAHLAVLVRLVRDR
jgi:hypothetical protein